MIHFFDLDGTLIDCNCSFAFSKYLFAKGIFSFKDLLNTLFLAIRYRFFNMELDDLHKKAFQLLFKNKKAHIFEEEAEKFVPLFLNKHLNQKTYALLKEAQAKKESILLLSSSPSFLVAPIAKMLNISFKSTCYHQNQGIFTSIEILMNGKEKAKYVIQKKESIAYSDSLDDFPLLEMVEKVTIITKDKKLLKLAKSKGWTIL